MKAIGIVLAIVGIGMLIFNGFNYTKKEKVVDIGPVEINADKEESVSWPTYAGAIVLLAGIGLVVMDRRNRNKNKKKRAVKARFFIHQPFCSWATSLAK